MVVKHVKGRLTFVNQKLCSLRVHGIPFISIHIFLFFCTSGISCRTPVPQGLLLNTYLTSPHKYMNVYQKLI